MTAATSVSKRLYEFSPFMVQLQDCSFVRETFTSISNNNCPRLQQYNTAGTSTSASSSSVPTACCPSSHQQGMMAVDVEVTRTSDLSQRNAMERITGT